MPRCPKCNYILVLLEKRLKYKCAKCGSLYLQKSTEYRDFRNWNKIQRELDKHNLKLESKRKKLSEEERKLKTRENAKKYRLENKIKYRIHSQKFYYKNKDNILAHKKIYRQVSKDKYNEWKKTYRNHNIERTRLLTRISFWRNKQKRLALRMLKNDCYEAYTNEISNRLPTLLHSERLLFKLRKNIKIN